MQNLEGRRRRRAAFSILNSIFAFAFTASLHAAQVNLSVDKRTLSLDDSVAITLGLAGSFARIDRPMIPLQNLKMDGVPSESSEVMFINGSFSQRKTYTFRARPKAAGAAVVGPLTIRTADGQAETLPAIELQVLADTASESNDPLKIVRELLATGRDPIFLIAEADKQEVFAGEEVVVTWTLYNGTNVQQYGIADIPKLADFWTEELDVRDERAEQIGLAGLVMQKLVVRRAALFPLRSGSLTVEPMSISAAVMKRVATNDPFGLFEGMMVDVRRRASPLTIVARPVPDGPPVVAVGEVALQCGTPSQHNGGPVSIEVMMSGRANLRAVPPPAWASDVDGSVQIVGGNVSAERRRDEASMTRRWRFLLFPAHAGAFVIPPLTSAILTPTGERRTLRCEERTLMVQAVDAAATAPPSNASRPAAREALRRSLPVIAIAALLLVLLAIAAPHVTRAIASRRELRELMRESPSETRAAVDDWLVSHETDAATLLRETSDRGDAYRALRSLLDGADRLEFDRRELRARLRAVVENFVS
jgi:hypothetical protein